MVNRIQGADPGERVTEAIPTHSYIPLSANRGSVPFGCLLCTIYTYIYMYVCMAAISRGDIWLLAGMVQFSGTDGFLGLGQELKINSLLFLFLFKSHPYLFFNGQILRFNKHSDIFHVKIKKSYRSSLLNIKQHEIQIFNPFSYH